MSKNIRQFHQRRMDNFVDWKNVSEHQSGEDERRGFGVSGFRCGGRGGGGGGGGESVSGVVEIAAVEACGFFAQGRDILARRRDEAAEILTKEEGKNIGEARGEVDRGVGLLRYYAGMWGTLTGETVPSMMDGRFLYTQRAPLGVVALISPWNFPSAIPVWKSAPALLCGNTVVLKTVAIGAAIGCDYCGSLRGSGAAGGRV